MLLNVLERLIVMGLLPDKDNYTNLKLLRVARESLSFTEEENKLLNFRMQEVNGKSNTIWDQSHLVAKATQERVDGDVETQTKLVLAKPEDFEMVPIVGEVDIELGEVVTNIIIKTLKTLEEATPSELEDKHFTVYEKFVLPSTTQT
ncbi:hypothetical protein LCGC14_1198890 [marine sediment metagenome]|uniref:Uncharacterized protein n=1 Tax=marine sediment metagenome TaxID=412755 RepID=A0A0F9LM21_9ZZZZ